MAAAVVEAVEAAAEPAEEAAGAVGSGGIGLDPTRINLDLSLLQVLQRQTSGPRSLLA